MSVSPWAVGVIPVVMEHTVSGTPQRNVFHVFDPALETSTVTVDALHSAVLQWWVFGFLGFEAPALFVGQPATLANLIVTHIPSISVGKILRHVTSLTGIFGASLAPMLPGNATACLTWDAGISGRGLVGRTYPVGLTEDALAGGNSNRISRSYADRMAAAYSSLVYAVGSVSGAAGPLRLCLFHRSGLIRMDPVTHSPVSIFATPLTGCRMVHTRVASQRGRVPGSVAH